jgi:altronate dehydratase small subunit
MKNALLISPKDNLVVVLKNIKKVENIVYLSGENTINKIVAINNIPVYHKVAITDIQKNGVVKKYGESIGIAKQDIKKGEHIHEHNLISVRDSCNID